MYMCTDSTYMYSHAFQDNWRPQLFLFLFPLCLTLWSNLHWLCTQCPSEDLWKQRTGDQGPTCTCIVPFYCSLLLFPSIVPFYCSLLSFPSIVPFYRSLLSFPSIVPFYRSLLSFPSIVPFYRSLLSFPSIVPFYCSLLLFPSFFCSHCV